ncbi:MAG: hypothetical protein AAF586_06905 [Planctomycetota bacterium]
MSKSSSKPLYLTFGAVLLVAALPVLAFSSWFFYDGAVAYPAQQRRQLAYRQIEQQYPPSEVHARWVALAGSNGWPTQTPGPPMSDTSIVTQYLLGSICALIGVIGLLGPGAVLLILAGRLNAKG